MENHPLASFVLAHCQQYPAQGAAIFQSYLDLSLAQGWSELEAIDLEECSCVVLRGISKKKSTPTFVYPISLSAPTSLAFLSSVFAALDNRYALDSEKSTEPLYMAIVERDSSCVYYVLRNGIVSPKEVPE